MRRESDWELIDDGMIAPGVSTGVRKYIRSTGDDYGTVEVRYEGYDVPLILSDNKRAQNDGFNRKSEMWHVGRIPNSVIIKWRAEHGIDIWNPDHQDAVRRLLNSSEWMHLKRAPIVI